MSDKLPWKLASPSLILKCIEKWRGLDFRKHSDAEIDKAIQTFLDSLGVYPVSTTPKNSHSLWRIRRFGHLFSDVSELWEPPSQKTGMGRCNAAGHPVLYVSEKLRTPFEELLIQPNEQVYVIKYKQKDHFSLKRPIPEDLEITDINGSPIYDDESMLSYQILREFVRSEFLKPVGKGTEYLHRISSSMCRVWFDSPDSDGWIYPSVPSPNDFNIAIKPSPARERLEIQDVRIARMISKQDALNTGKVKKEFLPFFHAMSMIIKSDFRGEIKGDATSWAPSEALGGDF